MLLNQNWDPVGGNWLPIGWLISLGKVPCAATVLLQMALGTPLGSPHMERSSIEFGFVNNVRASGRQRGTPLLPFRVPRPELVNIDTVIAVYVLFKGNATPSIRTKRDAAPSSTSNASKAPRAHYHYQEDVATAYVSLSRSRPVLISHGIEWRTELNNLAQRLNLRVEYSRTTGGPPHDATWHVVICSALHSRYRVFPPIKTFE